MEDNNILSDLPDEIPISMINIAGTHDSAAANVSFAKWAACQSLTIKEQLEAGVRFLDLRLCKQGGVFRLVHSTADCFEDESRKKLLTFDRVLQWCSDFLRENPGEAIILSIKKDRGLKGPFDKAFFSSFYSKYVSGNDLWFAENRIPKLGEVRGRLVLFRRCKSNAKEGRGLDFSIWKNQKTAADAEPFTVTMNDEFSAVVQDSYAVPPHAKWYICREVMDRITPSPNKAVVNFLSTSGSGGPVVTSEIINSKFEKYDISRDKPSGWILLDFATKELCDRITQTN